MKQVRWLTLTGCFTVGSSAAFATVPAMPQTPTVPAPVHAASVPGQSARTEQVLLNKPVSLELQRVPLIEALQQLQRQSGMKLIYSDDDLAGKRVNATVREMLPLDALRLILRGTGLTMRTGTDGRVAIWKDDAAKVTSGAQDTIRGFVRGRVFDASSKRPISYVTVSVAGTNTSTVTTVAGAYRVISLRPGKYVLAARMLGYTVVEKPVTVVSGDTVDVDFVLTTSPQRLNEVVTTGAGDRKRVEVGNSSTLINVEEIMETTLIPNLSDLIRSRAPGTQVLASSGTVGSGSRIRIRGVSSLLANSDPIIIIDGIRVDAVYSQNPTTDANSTSSAGENQLNSRVSATSRLDDIDPETIETIEILKGPSAATLYGSDAANGVIVIKTKRGRPGPTRWSLATVQGLASMKAKFADAWTGWGTSPTAPTLANCSLGMAANLLCKLDSVTHYNPLNSKESSPFGTGYNSKYTAQVSGGSSQIQYFLGGTYTNDIGLLKLPASEVERLRPIRGGVPLPEWTKRPNVLNGTSVNANITTQVNPKLDLGVNANYSSQYHRDASQNASGFISESYGTPGYRDSLGQGWGTTGPGANFLQRNSDVVKRLFGGVNANARPATWITFSGIFGMDYTSRRDDVLLRANDVLGLATSSMGASSSSTRGRADAENTGRNASLTSTFTLPISERTRLRSSAGLQYNRTENNSFTMTATGLAAGSDVMTNATVLGLPQERRSATATAGWFLDESFAVGDRLFATAALRGDAGSAFGRAAKPMLYPKFNASWLISQESFFPKSNVLSNLRLRTAFGQAGVQPGIDARFRSYRSQPTFPNGINVSGITILSVGNTKLVPERSVEYEVGFDIGLWDDRMTVDLTTYNKLTKNALITRTLPPSIGIMSRQENVGEVANHGLEISTTARPIMTRMLDWSFTLGFSRNSNKLVKLGTNTMATAFSGQTRFVEGYPVNGFWGRPITGYADLDSNGVLSISEIQLADSPSYVGQPFPKGEVSFQTTFATLSGRLSFTSGFSFQDGLTQFNSSLYRQCSSDRCRMTVDPTTSLRDQAIALSVNQNSPYAGYETVSWLRWNNASVTMMAPRSVTRALRSSSTSVSLMGRNLWHWSKYRGADPEVNSTTAGNNMRDMGGVPQTRDWSLRVNLNY